MLVERSRAVCVFFFQAEDGIRDGHVTGVQTCALPISWPKVTGERKWASPNSKEAITQPQPSSAPKIRHGRPRAWSRPVCTTPRKSSSRSEERRVGKECRWRRGAQHEKKKKERGGRHTL